LKLLGVDAARGIAALLVLLLHAGGCVSDPKDYGVEVFWGIFTFGRAGVDFFFVLSGFIITYVHQSDIGRPERLSLFWRKRLLRIYPSWWVALFLMGALLTISPTRGLAERDIGHIIASVLLIPEAAQEPILGVGWSLRHEMIFYGLFSVLIVSRRLGIAVLGAWMALIMFNLVWATAAGAPFFTGILDNAFFRVFNIQFFFGIAVALLIRRHPPWRPVPILLLGLVVFLTTGMFESFGPKIQHEWPPRHLSYALGAAMILYGLATLDRARALRVPAPLLELGTASYSIYLVHGMTLLVMQQAVRHARVYVYIPIEIAYLVIVATGLTAGLVFSRVIERPLLRLGNQVFVSERRAG
jgi:exopolysaccharide production protein ExoZ